MSECELYQLNPFSGWAAQHVMLPEEELETRFVPLRSDVGKLTGKLVKVEVCGRCARLLDRDYDAGKPREGEK